MYGQDREVRSGGGKVANNPQIRQQALQSIVGAPLHCALERFDAVLFNSGAWDAAFGNSSLAE